MCDSDKICTCCGSTKPLHLEVGKTYVNGNGRKVRIICINGRTEVCGDTVLPVIGLIELPSGNERIETYTLDGYYSHLKSNLNANLVKEYREPRVTKKDVLLVKGVEPNSTKREVLLRNVGEALNSEARYYWTEISRKTVEFVED